MVFLAAALMGCRAMEEENIVYLVTPVPTTAAVALIPTPVPTSAPTPSPAPTATPTPTPLSLEARLQLYIEGMTTEEKIGQMVMFGFSGTKKVSEEFGELMEEYAIGNVILYGANISRTDSDGGFARCAQLTEDIEAHNAGKIPLLISTDVEGGNVTRFKWEKWPTHAATLGQKNNVDSARSQFAAIGAGLLRAGINTDLAPVLDVAHKPEETFLKKRIISSDEKTVARIGVACVEGLQEAGCLSVVKHFPGHGAATADSHDTTPVVKKTLDQLEEYELFPFAQAVTAGADGVMVAHILYPNIDSQHIASQSRVFLTEILREQLGFSGFIMSDDFRMQGLRRQTSLEEGAVTFILAGGDLILCGANHSYQRAILGGLYQAVADGTLSQQRLNESVYRILWAKMQVTDWEP